MNYKYFLHAHSHVMLLGWVFNALFAGLVWMLFQKQKSIPVLYQILFWFFQLTVLGMLVTFPLMGYAFWSILFSTLHILLSFYFVYLLTRQLEALKATYIYATKFLRWSLVFLLLSSLGPFALGVIISQGFSHSHWYDLSIYYYLHFQYNGWISFAFLGMWFWIIENREISLDNATSKYFFWSMTGSCIPAFALSALWIHPPFWVYLIGYAAAVTQVAALIFLYLLLSKLKRELRSILTPWSRACVELALLAFTMKILLQALSAIPEIADLAYQVRNFSIGFLHLVFLGFITLFLLGWFLQMGLLSMQSFISKTGLVLFVTGIIGSEFYLVLPPLLGAAGAIHEGLLFFSGLMLVGLIGVNWPVSLMRK